MFFFLSFMVNSNTIQIENEPRTVTYCMIYSNKASGMLIATCSLVNFQQGEKNEMWKAVFGCLLLQQSGFMMSKLTEE